MDFHGHGQREEGQRGDFGTMADAVAEAVDLVTSEMASMAVPPGRIIIMGHSLGSMALILRGRFSVSSTTCSPCGTTLIL